MKKEKVDAEEVKRRLSSLADEKYRKFHGSLVPGLADSILGVRLPLLRTLAKELSKMDWEEWFCAEKDTTYEVTMVKGLTMAYAGLPVDKRLSYIREFVKDINNWAVCDCFCNTLKEAKKYPDIYWDFLEPYFPSGREYEARFGAVMLLSHFVEERYLWQSVERLERIHQEGYYAKMAVAWAISVYFAKFPREMLEYLQKRHKLDDFTYRKSLQKITESYRVSRETKEVIREMKQRG